MIAQSPAEAPAAAFERAARSVLGSETELRIEQRDTDPPDEDAVALGRSVDGVVELSFSPDRTRVRLHCFVSREQRWVDREIAFGALGQDAAREAWQRGRLLGFAVASMFSDETERAPSTVAESERSEALAPAKQPAPARDVAPRRRSSRPRSLEFAGIMSSGVHGTAAGLGAMAGVRIGLVPGLFARGFLAGRAGNIPEAQASTRTAQAGVGLSFDWVPKPSSWAAGLRADGLLSYFEVSHLSEDDIVPDRRQRWLAGGDLLAEAGVRLAGEAGLHLAVGVEAMLGATEVFTHGNRVAIVPPLRAVAELGFRAHF